MSGEVFGRKIVHYIAAIVLLAALVPLQGNIDRRRVEEKLEAQDRPAIRPGEAAIGLLLAGFRGLAANVLWFRAMVLFEQGRVTEEIPLFQAISYLQPRFRATWSFGAWHMAYNVSAHFYERKDLTDEEVDRYRFECFKIGDEFLRKGIQYNYYNYELHWDLGFTILYYKQYKMSKEKGWGEEKEALKAALDEMRIATLFQPPLSEHPPYVDRIIAVIMREGGLLDDAYKVWYRLANTPANADRIVSSIMRECGMSKAEAENVLTRMSRWRDETRSVNLVRKHTSRVADRITVEEAKSYAVEMEKQDKLAEAYTVWHNLLSEAEKKKSQLAQDKLADPELVKQTEDDVKEFSESTQKLAEVLREKGTDVESLNKVSSEEGLPAALRQRIEGRFRALGEQAEKDREADIAETLKMYRELTKPAPNLDWWVLLFIPLFLLAAGYLLFGKESYAS